MKTAIAALALFAAIPAAAQMPPPPGEMMPGPGPGRPPMRGMKRMFASMSPAGRATMMASLKSADPRAGHVETQAARDRMLTILEADRLDPVALRRAMDDERESANASKVKQQTAMLAAFQQLSVADRRAFVADAREMRARMESREAAWRNRSGGPDGMPPPPPPQ